jgi:hypothetical protein
MDLREIQWGDIDLINLTEDRNQWMAREHGTEPSGSIKGWEVLEERHNWGLLEKGLAP